MLTASICLTPAVTHTTAVSIRPSPNVGIASTWRHRNGIPCHAPLHKQLTLPAIKTYSLLNLSVINSSFKHTVPTINTYSQSTLPAVNTCSHLTLFTVDYCSRLHSATAFQRIGLCCALEAHPAGALRPEALNTAHVELVLVQTHPVVLRLGRGVRELEGDRQFHERQLRNAVRHERRGGHVREVTPELDGHRVLHLRRLR